MLPKRPWLSHPVQSTDPGVGGRRLGEQQMGLSEDIKGTRILLVVWQTPTGSPPTSSWDALPVDPPAGPQTPPTLLAPDPYPFSPVLWPAPCAYSQWQQQEQALADGRWAHTESRLESADQGETTNLSFTATLGRTHGRIPREHRSLRILPKEEASRVEHVEP